MTSKRLHEYQVGNGDSSTGSKFAVFGVLWRLDDNCKETIMITSRRLLIALLAAIILTPGCGSRMDQSTRNRIAHVYGLALTDANAFVKYVRENPSLFAQGGAWESGVRRLGQALVGAGLRSIPGADVREKAYDIASSAGRPELGPKVYDDTMKSAADLVTMGQMLYSMPEIVEGVLREDYTAYRQSSFALSSSAIEMSKTLMLPADYAALKSMSYQLNAWVVLQYAQQI